MSGPNNDAVFRSAFDDALGGMCIKGLDGRFLHVNLAFAAMLGRLPEELIGTRFTDVTHADDAAGNADSLRRALAGEVDRYAAEKRYLRADGSTVWAEMSCRLVRDADGNALYFLTQTIDMTTRMRALAERDAHAAMLQAVIAQTESRHAADAMAKARDAALAATAAKSAFLATVSHELRTPMNGVIGVTGLLLEFDLSTEQRELLDVVRTSGDELLVIINDILDFSRIEAGQLELERQPFDVRACVNGALDVFAGDAKGLHLVSHVDAACPGRVVGDGPRLRRTLVNLVGNAVKFTQQGEVVVSASVNPTDTPGAVELQFSVADTGIGIPADRLDHLFRPFSQGDTSTTRQYGGTGLGLAISHGLVHAMGGRLSVLSEVGNGSTFTFTALMQQDIGQTALPAGPPWTAVKERLGVRQGPALRVLLVEDNAINRKVGELLLRRLGHPVDLAVNGREAVDAVRLVDYDVVLMDLQMPELDGLDATRILRRDLPPGRQPYIIAMTASVLVEDRDACLAAGMDDYVPKPVHLDRLRGALASVVRPTRSRAAASA